MPGRLSLSLPGRFRGAGCSLALAALALGVGLMPAGLASAADRPNIVLIFVDDLGYADIGPFGSKTNATPHLDRMAKEGRRLTSFYAAPVCSPSRASLMTGCYPKRVLPIPHVLFPSSAVGLDPSEKTLAEVLKDEGYATACIGKWHLGDQPEMLPTRQGFDYYFGLPYSNDMGPPEDGAKSNPGRPAPQSRPNGPLGEVGITGLSQPPLPLLENETVVARVKAGEQAELTEQYTEKAVKFIHDHQKGPFFLYFPHTAVHFPLYPSAKFVNQSKGGGLLGDWTQEVDGSVGRVLDTLRELKLEENTLVIFTSDNGGSLRNGSNNTPLRGTKGDTFEGGIRVPTIVWWPGRIPAGTETAGIATTMDVLPTCTALAGGKLPSRKIDGVDLGAWLTGKEGAASPRDTFLYYRGLDLRCVRQGPWKLILKSGALYNLDDDIGETQNVAAEHPEQVKQLQALADASDADLGQTDLGPGCRELGRVKNPQPLISADGVIRPGFEPQR
ncbi:sulfatase family protein [Lignipirellula cremea]|uniref:Arylsulfatase n=1 Tax=Lignipirellula cremea TaxID=2528010 RepID=A0A518DNV5_9BACT|nr:sulfatase [Lignipirellula cremea]QDU93522.1 Arylsulfatase [Lignipirellula cremea]